MDNSSGAVLAVMPRIGNLFDNPSSLARTRRDLDRVAELHAVLQRALTRGRDPFTGLGPLAPGLLRRHRRPDGRARPPASRELRMTTLFDPVTIGDLKLPNRIF